MSPHARFSQPGLLHRQYQGSYDAREVSHHVMMSVNSTLPYWEDAGVVAISFSTRCVTATPARTTSCPTARRTTPKARTSGHNE